MSFPPFDFAQDELRRESSREGEEGGTVVYQYDEDLPTYTTSTTRPLFESGAFDVIAGYRNGPAWFKTYTSEYIPNDAGIMFFVGRKRQLPLVSPTYGDSGLEINF